MSDDDLIKTVAEQFGVQPQTVKTRWNRWVDSACRRAGMSGIGELNQDQYRLALVSFGRACADTSSSAVRRKWEQDWASKNKVQAEVIEGELIDNDTAMDLSEDLDTSVLATRQAESEQTLEQLRENFYLSNPMAGLAHVVVSQMDAQAVALKQEVKAQTFRKFAGAVNEGRREAVAMFLEDLKAQAEACA